MKKTLTVLCLLVLLFTFAKAEPVSGMLWSVPVEGESRTGEYTGDTDGGIPNGFGIFLADGAEPYAWHYIGQWQDGLMHGPGAIYWSDGSFEHGEYENGRFVYGTCNYDGAQADVFSDPTSEYVHQLNLQADERLGEIIYVGNVYTHKFHLATCEYAANIGQKNKIIFSTREEAIEAGYTPCRVCDP